MRNPDQQRPVLQGTTSAQPALRWRARLQDAPAASPVPSPDSSDDEDDDPFWDRPQVLTDACALVTRADAQQRPAQRLPRARCSARAALRCACCQVHVLCLSELAARTGLLICRVRLADDAGSTTEPSVQQHSSKL